jgi:hypothetical protein
VCPVHSVITTVACAILASQQANAIPNLVKRANMRMSAYMTADGREWGLLAMACEENAAG